MLIPLALATLAAPPWSGDPGTPGEPPLAMVATKALTAARDPSELQAIDAALLLIVDGRIEWIGRSDEAVLPEGTVVRDLGERWIMPGLVDLHSHIAGPPDWATHVYLTNPGQRVSTAVVPDNELLRRGIAGGVTTILFIPGSATNIGGQGVLLKTGFEHYEDMRIRDPGSLKLAQAGNPESWAVGVSRAFMNWNTRNTFRRGLAYAALWELHERGDGPEPPVNIQWEVFRDLYAKRTQVSTHTQLYQVVLSTITMMRDELDLDVYIDHGTFDGWRAAALAQEKGVAAILGPRQISYSVDVLIPGRAPYRLTARSDGRFDGVAAKYQEGGHRQIGFNTDAIDLDLWPEVMRGNFPQTEELSLQAAMGVRYGMSNDRMEAVRGITIVPAVAARLAERVGSLEPGKDADVLVITGDPADQRTSVEQVLLEGRLVYDTGVDERRW